MSLGANLFELALVRSILNLIENYVNDPREFLFNKISQETYGSSTIDLCMSA